MKFRSSSAANMIVLLTIACILCRPARPMQAAGNPAELVRDIIPGTGSSVGPDETARLTAAGTRVFFLADDGMHGRELWVSDGTGPGTFMVKDINPGPASAFRLCPYNYDPDLCLTSFTSLALEHTLYFLADDGSHGWELWLSDGTPNGTHMVADIAQGAGSPFLVSDCSIRGGFCTTYPEPGLTAVGTRLFFVADAGAGRELWRTDGSANGTAQVRDIAPGMAGADPSDLMAIGGQLFFLADDGTHGVEIWKSDGTPNGTVVLKDIAPGPASPFLLTSCPDFCYITRTQSLTPAGNALFFFADDGSHGLELWRSDGTTTGTVLTKDIVPGSGSPVLTTECRSGGSFCSNSLDTTMTALGTTLIFSAQNGAQGREFWRSDGTLAGTILLGDLNVGVAGSNPGPIAVSGNRLFFSAIGAGIGRELWVTDGTPAGTRLLRDIAPGPADASPNLLGMVSGYVCFTATDNIHGRELWVSDGTTAGTALIADLNPGAGDAFPDPGSSSISPSWQLVPAANLNQRLFFAADDRAHGQELWLSDGTSAGTALVQDIAAGAASTEPTELTPIGTGQQGQLLFTADDLVHGRELWALQISRLNLFPPTAHPGSAITTHDTAVSGRLSAEDRDGNPLTFALMESAHKGSVVLDDPIAGTFTYTPHPGETGADSFSFIAGDSRFDSAPATILVLIDPRQTFAPLIEKPLPNL